jgi:ferredoxin/coenzyme F420-reducing hydrogenase delta subunit
VKTAVEPARVSVGVCDRLQPGNGSDDLADLCRSLEASLPGVSAEVVPDLSRSPEQAAALASRTGAERLVLGVCPQAVSRHEFQAWTRKAGLDPFALELVHLPEGSFAGTVERVALRLAAAVARARAFPGSEPEQLRPRLLVQETTLSRRTLLTLPPFTYEAVPSVDREVCSGASRCGLCAQACPAEAIRAQENRIVVDRERCSACGLCVVACPVGAVGLPGSSLSQYEAEIATLLRGGADHLLFACRDATLLRQDVAGCSHREWVPVQVPCLGMVTPGWMLQAIARGAERVGLATCQDCRFSSAALFESRIDYVRALLRSLGDESASERVSIVRDESSPMPSAPDAATVAVDGSLTLSEPAATAEAVLILGERYSDVETVPLAHTASPMGIVKVRSETCTLCGTCANACPTGALTLENDEQEVVLSYDARQCVACRRCISVCPESQDKTLTVTRMTDFGSLRRGRISLARASLARCRNCGRPIAPTRLLERIEELLAGPDSQPLLSILSGLCADCRGSAPMPVNADAQCAAGDP